MQVPVILIKYDSSPQVSFLNDLPQDNNFQVQTITDKNKLLEQLGQISQAVLFLDFTSPDLQHHLDLLRQINGDFPSILIIAVLPPERDDILTTILQEKIFFYLHEPCHPDEISLALNRAATQLRHCPQAQVKVKSDHGSFHGLIGQSPPMRRLFDMITLVADDDSSTVLLRGESGTGKELVAKAIHAQGSRRGGNFVPVNCAAIPDDLLESELFGYTKGAFTGANQNKIGRIQHADGGTLFLDEIGDMKPSLQGKLLRVLQEKEFEPVGGLKAYSVNTRVIAATHCNLERQVEEGTFREDLYYRLSVIPLTLPPLRDKKEDIPLLLDTFIKSYAKQRSRPPLIIGPQIMEALFSYDWQGNVRELENLVQFMSVLFAGKKVQLDDLPDKIKDSFAPDNPPAIPTDSCECASCRPAFTAGAPLDWHEGEVNFNELISDYETQLIIRAMELAAGNKKEAARLLGLKRTTLLEKIKKKELVSNWET
ncbi:MAG: sigma-54-dependent Fis family transcriptional regulator [Desulfobulbaceae bacterium]|uniref:Sigma-54-dependent Fis family transcriptional regulator n=1 Tax=Candidatus Desulfatifera sulfidica TaxID=2841691 RepID=A0A8J6T8T5_9BACT|nr:sigma-54-dependent Fis family transcriptional regulator [Candidatus Desulfatifera sulfidica]